MRSTVCDKSRPYRVVVDATRTRALPTRQMAPATSVMTKLICPSCLLNLNINEWPIHSKKQQNEILNELWQMSKLVGSKVDILSKVSAWCDIDRLDKKLTFWDRPRRQQNDIFLQTLAGLVRCCVTRRACVLCGKTSGYRTEIRALCLRAGFGRFCRYARKRESNISHG